MMFEEMPTQDVIMAVLNDPVGSDTMVLFLKAVTAAAFMKKGSNIDFVGIIRVLLNEDRSAIACIANLTCCVCKVWYQFSLMVSWLPASSIVVFLIW